jgi:hypothetical protein
MTTPLSTTPIGLQPPAFSGCYLLHFSEPLAHAAHYVGYSDNIAERLSVHLDVHRCQRHGAHDEAWHKGSPLVCAAIRAGSSVRLVQVWPDQDRTFERRLHHRHGSRLCPEARCQSVQQARRAQLRLPQIAG